MTLRRYTARLAAWALTLGVAGLLLALLPVAAPPHAAAADLREFDPGHIISDVVFFDEGSMSAAAVQAFLDEKGANCVRGNDGSPCLKNYVGATTSRAPTTLCPGGYAGSAGESAAMIIYKVAQACGVNPQVLLVTLQKEMGFIRSTNPTAKMYQRAMGYGCPDNSTGVCDSAYYGLHNQLYSAASQFQRYVANPTRYSYRAGITNYILYHPYNNCGRQSVYIQNGATAALYNYTPYVPNAAALNAGYGTGDGCSSYGNRNFYSYFTDWFGSTRSSGSGAVTLKYEALGGAAALGSPLAPTDCTLPAGGCARAYQYGSIYWSPATGAALLQGDVMGRWWSTGGAGGPLGYPLADVGAVPGGFAAAFQGGSVYWSAVTGAHAVTSEFLHNWWSTGGVTGPLGFPLADSGPVPGGRATAFQGGSVYWSPTSGAHWLSGDVLARYWSLGSSGGELGFPTSDLADVPGGSGAAFQRGSMYWSAATGAKVVRGAERAAWWATGGVSGPLGFPVGDQAAVAGGSATAFQHGSIYASPATGARVLSGPVLAGYWAAGAAGGALGFPVADQGPVTGGEAAAFQGGSIYWSPATGAHAVRGEVRASWWQRGGLAGPLGFPTASTETVTADGRAGLVSDFTGGTLYWSQPTGTRLLQGDVLAAYRAAGGPEGIGFPVSDQAAVPGGVAAAFENGSVYSSAGTGAHVVRGPVRSSWWARGGISGSIGFPVADTTAVTGSDGSGGLVGRFSGGTLYWSAATGTRLLQGPVLAAYEAAGGPAALGFPVADEGAVPGGTAVALQRASIYSSPVTGARVVRGAVLSAYWAAGSITGQLGFPTADTVAVTGAGGSAGLVGRFSGGAVYWSPATGARRVGGDVLAAYEGAGGPGVLGFPVADQGALPGGTAVALQGGSIYASAATGARVLRGAVLSAYWASGSVTGPLGYPTADTVALAAQGLSGTATAFQHGTIYETATTGARVVLAAVDDLYRAAGGPASGYGWPVSSTSVVAGAARNEFQTGDITA